MAKKDTVRRSSATSLIEGRSSINGIFCFGRRADGEWFLRTHNHTTKWVRVDSPTPSLGISEETAIETLSALEIEGSFVLPGLSGETIDRVTVRGKTSAANRWRMPTR